MTTDLGVEAIYDFISFEGELADEHRLEEWLELWNPDRAAYFVPCGALAPGRLEVAIIRDNFDRMTERVRRLRTGSAHAQDPPSCVSRVMSRPRITPGDEGSVVATANFVCVEVRPDRETVWAGKTLYTIAPRTGGDGLEIWRKEVRLVNAQYEIPALTFLI
jgi:p-cumate 2,3-dioxygenase beta subunit